MKKVNLKPISLTDLDDVMALYSDESAMHFFGRAITKDPNEVKKIIQSNINWNETKTGIRYVAYDDKKFIGIITLKRYDERFKRAEIDYIVASNYRQKGYASAILKDFSTLVFSKWDLNRISAYVDPKNLASQRLLKKMGFLNEGYLRNWGISADGKGESLYVYSLIKEDLER